jgi:hypothetical protein
MSSIVVANDESPMLSPRVLVGAANAFAGLGDLDQCDEDPAGEFIRRQAEQPDGTPWSTAFLSHVGFWSHFDHQSQRSVWPLPRTGDPNVLSEFAIEHGICRGIPAEYDLFTLYSPFAKVYVRSGIILRIDHEVTLPKGLHFECITLEADTDWKGESRGKSTRRARRFLSSELGDCFIRWTELGARRDAA